MRLSLAIGAFFGAVGLLIPGMAVFMGQAITAWNWLSVVALAGLGFVAAGVAQAAERRNARG